METEVRGTHVMQLQYLDDNNQRQTAWAGTTHVVGPVTSDPEWYGSNPANGAQGGPWEKLTYRGTDRNVWQTEMHAQDYGDDNKVHVWIKSYDIDGNGENQNFEVFNWQGQKVRVTIDVLVENNHAPRFTIEVI